MKEELLKKLQNPNVQKGIDLISIAEGTFNAPHPYLVKFGGSQMKHDYSDAFTKTPFTYVDKEGNKKSTFSTATGKYQFLKNTWNELSKELNLKDLSPENQDIGALFLIKKAGALSDLEKGDYHKAFKKLNKIWASLEDSEYGQPTHSTDYLLNKYNTLVGLSSSKLVPEVESQANDTSLPNYASLSQIPADQKKKLN